MAIVLSDLTKFGSRLTRKAIGDRKLPSIEKIGESGLAKSSGSGGNGLVSGLGQVLGAIWGGFEGFLFLVGRGLLSGLNFTFTGAFSWLVSTTTFLANFDWNASDTEIDAGLRSRYLAWASSLGSAIGGTLGWFACGILPNASIFAFNPAMGAYVLTHFGEEAQEELASYLVQIIKQSLNVATATAFAQTYKTTRSIIKATPGIKKLFPNIDKWGAKDGAVFTISKSIEDKIEKIPNPFIRGLVDAAYEEFFDACIDAGFTLTSAMDSFVAMQRATNKDVANEIIEIKPDREADETLYLAGSQTNLKSVIPQVLAQHQMIRDRDLGDVFQLPPQEYINGRTRQTFTLHLSWHSRKSPPYGTANSKGTQRASCTIHNLKRSSIDWTKIKRIAGPQGHQFGKFAAIASYENGKRSVIYSNTSQGAVSLMKELLTLSDSEIGNINVTELTNEGKRKITDSQQKGNLFVYPQKACITYSVDRADRAREIRSIKFELWPDIEPPDFKEKVLTLLAPVNK